MNLKPLILGHRGASALAPENTLAAFSRAISDGADGIEFDVRLSRDQVPVVIHDASLKRTGLLDRQVSELTATELQRIDVGRWFAQRLGRPDSRSAPPRDDERPRERIPLLGQVLDLYLTIKGTLYIEMKCDRHDAVALANEVVRVVKGSGMSERVVVESFDLKAVAEVKRVDANIRTSALFEPRISNPISALRPLRMVDRARDCGANEIALHYLLAKSRLIENARTEGFEVVVWTVDDPKWIARAASMGIKALIANNPAAMVQARNRLR